MNTHSLFVSVVLLLVTVLALPASCQTSRVDTVLLNSGKKIPATMVQYARKRCIWFTYPDGPQDSALMTKVKAVIPGIEIPPPPPEPAVVEPIHITPPPAEHVSFWKFLLADLSLGINGGDIVGGAGLIFKVLEGSRFGLNAAVSFKNRGGLPIIKEYNVNVKVDTINRTVIVRDTIPTRENDIAIGPEFQFTPFDIPLYFYAAPSFVYDITDSRSALAGKIGIGYEIFGSCGGSVCLSFDYFKTQDIHRSGELEFRMPF